jgi:hypothetical protein
MTKNWVRTSLMIGVALAAGPPPLAAQSQFVAPIPGNPPAGDASRLPKPVDYNAVAQEGLQNLRLIRDQWLEKRKNSLAGDPSVFEDYVKKTTRELERVISICLSEEDKGIEDPALAPRDRLERIMKLEDRDAQANAFLFNQAERVLMMVPEKVKEVNPRAAHQNLPGVINSWLETLGNSLKIAPQLFKQFEESVRRRLQEQDQQPPPRKSAAAINRMETPLSPSLERSAPLVL